MKIALIVNLIATLVLIIIVGTDRYNTDLAITRHNKHLNNITDSLYKQEANRLINTCVYDELREETFKLIKIKDDTYELHNQFILCERDECVMDMKYSTIWGHKYAVDEFLSIGEPTGCLK